MTQASSESRREWEADEESLLESEIELDSIEEDLRQAPQDSVPAAPAHSPAPVAGLKKYLTPGCQLYIVALLCGAGMKATSKLAMEQVDMLVLIFTRMSITLIISMVIMRMKGIEHYFWGAPEVRGLVFFRGFLGCLNLVLTMFALQYLSLPDQVVLSFLSPQVTAILARVILHEPYFWQQAAWSLVSFSGVVFIARPPQLFHSHNPDGEPTPGNSIPRIAELRIQAVIATLIVVLSASLVMITVRKIGTRTHALSIVGNYSAFAVLFSVVGMALDPSRATVPQKLLTWVLLIGAGIFGFLLQLLSSMALQLEEASHLANFRYTQILWAVLFEFAIWHDLPDIWTWSGIVLVAIGVVQSTLVRHRLLANNTTSK